jgi:hypothetical protein
MKNVTISTKLLALLAFGEIKLIKTADYLAQIKLETEKLQKLVDEGRKEYVEDLNHNKWVVKIYQELADRKIEFCGYSFIQINEVFAKYPFKTTIKCYPSDGALPINFNKFVSEIYNKIK